MMDKPDLYVLAGVNGAGKSSIGGAILKGQGLDWFNPDAFARALVQECGFPQEQANGLAWAEGMAQLDDALAHRAPFAFETTLGGTTVFRKIRTASRTHHVRIWYCGLDSPQMHLERVRLRVSGGGHDIPKAKIDGRWETSRTHLIELIPFLTELGVFDNSRTVQPGQPVPDPRKILHLRDGSLLFPQQVADLETTPDWAQAIVECVLEWVFPPN